MQGGGKAVERLRPGMVYVLSALLIVLDHAYGSTACSRKLALAHIHPLTTIPALLSLGKLICPDLIYSTVFEPIFLTCRQFCVWLTAYIHPDNIFCSLIIHLRMCLYSVLQQICTAGVMLNLYFL